MSDKSISHEHKEVVIAVYKGEHQAKKVMGILEEGTGQISVSHDESVIISMDSDGKVSLPSSNQKKKGLLGGALTGIVVGALVGFPIVGIVVGGAVGAFAGKKRTKKALSDEADTDVLQELIGHMEPDSSMLIAEVDDWAVGSIVDSLQSYDALTVYHAPVDELAAALGGQDTAVPDTSAAESKSK